MEESQCEHSIKIIKISARLNTPNGDNFSLDALCQPISKQESAFNG